MTTDDIVEHEKKSFHKQMKEIKLLPHKYFNIGVGLVIISLLGLVSLKFIGDYAIVSQIIKNVLLISLLVITVSKDKEEDEMTLKLRSQAFVLAFIWGVIYAVVQPIISMIFNSFLDSGAEGWAKMSMHQILFFMLLVQIAFYHGAKKMR